MVEFAKNTGLKKHPENYPGLDKHSSVDEIRLHLSKKQGGACKCDSKKKTHKPVPEYDMFKTSAGKTHGKDEGKTHEKAGAKKHKASTKVEPHAPKKTHKKVRKVHDKSKALNLMR